jgi:hypothetical protein
MNFPDYKSLVGSAAKQADFLSNVVAAAQAAPGDSLSAVLKREFAVGGAPFDQVKYLTALESHSDEWDLDEASQETQERLVRGALAVKALDPGFDVPHFIHGFQFTVNNLQDKGVNVENRPVAASKPAGPGVEQGGAEFSL